MSSPLRVRICETKPNRIEPCKAKHLIFIEAGDRSGLDRVIALVGTLTDGNFEESSVEIIGRKSWDTAKIRHPRIRFHTLD